MSQERYFELYRQFLNQTITEEDFRDLMKWVSNDTNDALLRRYMELLWIDNEWDADVNPLDWADFKIQLQNEVHKNSHAKIIPHPSGEKKINRVWYYVASLVIMILAGMTIFTFMPPNVQIYNTAYGETREIILDDGSRVTLNANSLLEWTPGWEKSGERYVKLEGEAFFDVVHTGKNKGFTVETNDLKLRVLGTTFNVSSRRDQTDVTLETGKIQLDLKLSEDSVLSMEPGDFVRYSSTVRLLEKTTVETLAESANWLDGILRFEDVTVEEMFEEIEDQYGKKLISSDTELLARRMFTGIPYEDWAVAKEALELALGVTFEERNNKLYVK